MMNKRLTRMVEGSMRAVGKNVAVQWLGLCANMAAVLAVAWLLGRLLAGELAAGAAALAIGVALAALVVKFACAMASSRLSYQASERVKGTLRQRIYEKLLRLGPGYHQEVSTSEVVQVAVEGVDQLETYFGKYLPQLFYSLLAPLTLFAVLAFVNLPAAAVLLACVPLIPLSIMAVQKFAKKLLAKYWSKYTSLGDGFLENLQGLTTLKIYGSDEAKNQEMNERAEDFRKVTMRVLIMQLNSVTLMDLIAYGGAALGIIVAVSQTLAGNLGFAGCVAILLLAADFFLPLRLLGSFFHIAMNGMAASEKIFKLLDLPEPAAGKVASLDAGAGLRLAGVGYSYDGRRQVLQEVALAAGPGLTAIVGESGSGKSTLAGLLTGGNTGYTGQLTLGGVELRDIGPAALSKTVTLVNHTSYLFKGTVAENLRMAKPKATDEELWAVLRQVNLADFLQGENGLATALAEQGSNLSGGQRQRLALARGILHDTPVYIFDEATSNIDAESENDIAAVIWEMARSKTVVVIAHRLANVVPAGRVYLLEGGRVTESGRHEEMLAQNGAYARMYRAQQALEGAAGKEAAHA